MSKAKVLHIGEYVQGGVATYLYSLLSLNDRIESYAIMSESKSEKKWPIQDDRVFYYPYTRGIKSLPFAIWSVVRKISEIQPTVIYCHSTWAGLIGRIAILFTPPCRVIYNAHGWAFLRDTSEWKRKIYAFIEYVLAWKTDCIINVSQFEYDSAVEYGLPKKKLMVIYNGSPDTQEIMPCPIKMDKTKINILFVGRFDPQKGVDFLLKTYERLNRNDIHLYLIGDNVISDEMSIQMVDDKRKTFLGWIPHNAISGYYDACDIVIMPSRWEAFGLVAIEAMKFGKPVIVSDRGALPELVKHGQNGWVFHYDETGRSLLDCLMRLSKSEIASMSNTARQIFSKCFTEKKMLVQTEMVLLNQYKKNDV